MNQSETISRKLADAAERLALEHQKHAHLFSPEKRLTPDGKIKCVIVTCERPVSVKGLCAAHDLRRKHAPLGLSPQKPIGAKAGEFGTKWKGGVSRSIDGRYRLHTPDHPHASKLGKYVLRYRLVMESHLGRYLLPNEIVHHKNGDRTDDRIENLEVMTQGEHLKLHLCLNGKWSRRFEFCVRCGLTKSKHYGHGICNACEMRNRKAKL